VFNVGDVMFDATLFFKEKAKKIINFKKLGVKEDEYVLCTIHRAENTDNTSKLDSIFRALKKISTSIPVVLPLHPRTKHLISKLNKEDWLDKLIIINPVSYLEMLCLESSSKVILTDSGGVQKEAYFHNIPCITLRNETEWGETVDMGCNFIAGSNELKILEGFNRALNSKIEFKHSNVYGNGHAAEEILSVLSKNIKVKEKK
jgi:UDP-GlcNAc3NAcA epimerase